MDNQTSSNNVTVYLLFVLCILFVLMDGFELIKLSKSWSDSKVVFNSTIFEQCIKFKMLARTGFSIFSFLESFSSLTVSLLLCVSVEFFIEKFAKTYIYLNSLIFGPYLLGCRIIGIWFWDKVLYSCEDESFEGGLSFTSLFNLTVCILIGLVITFLLSLYESVEIYINSILQKQNSNWILRKCFWYVVIHLRSI